MALYHILFFFLDLLICIVCWTVARLNIVLGLLGKVELVVKLVA